MTELVISLAIEQLDGLLGEKVAFLQGAEEQLEGLKTDLTLMLDFLKESSRSRSRAHKLHHLISQVREMAHDIEVIIDTFIFTMNEDLESQSIQLNNFLRETESIRGSFREVNYKLVLQYQVEEEEYVGLSWNNEISPWKELNDDDMVGLAGLKDMLVDELGLSKKQLHISMIIGMGGLGKTTLARQVYNDAALVEGFDRRAWACVSDVSIPEEVLRVLIRQVGDVDEETLKEEMDVESLQRMISQELLAKSYFIVLDDVWDDTCINHVLHSLPTNDNSRGRVMLTGRSSNIVVNLDFVVNMSRLDSDVSWQLFVKTVFDSYHKCPKHLEEIGRKIVKKCNGLPLAIKEAGMQLKRLSQSVTEWEQYLDSMDLSITTEVLESSYHRLPAELKSCFVHMSFFKEGMTIRAEKFVHIWNAAGMARRGEVYDNETMEEPPRMYLDKLSGENMIMVEEYTIGTKIKSFRIDGFLHKISITKAEDEISFEILGNIKHHQPPGKPRHRAVYCNREKFSYSTKQDKHLLSLFFHRGGNFDLTPSYWESFELLRILDFEDFGLKSIPEMICTLVRLRYLGLRDNYLKELPHTFGCLKNLEVLDIALNFMIEVPDIIWKMDSIQHLFMSDIICQTPLVIDSLKCLQTLTYISVINWTYELANLEKMTSLRKLGIEELDENSDVSKLFTSLAKLTSLECLILRGFRFRSMPPLDDLSILDGLTQLKLDGRLTTLPKFPQSIIFLTLVNSCLHKDPMPEIEKLPNLYYIKLKNAFVGKEMVVSDDGFAALHILHIVELWHLRNFQFEFGAMPMLMRLEISSCPYLETFAEDSEYFNPEEFKMVTTKNIARKIRESGLFFDIKHVDIQPYE